MPGTPKPARRPRKAPKPSLASRADPHDCYQRAVQCVEAEIDFVDETFTALRKRKAARLREDFCGTANSSCEWVRRRRTNTAIGFDLDRPTLDWGLAHNVSRLTPSQRARVDLRQTDVLVEHPDIKGSLDCVLAMNFSFWVFRTRPVMLSYFKRVREDLCRDGVFFMDFYGGTDSTRIFKERRKIARASRGEPSVVGFTSPFTYVWDQQLFNPIDHDLVCKIHFAFPDGSRIRDAFTYHWRLWSLPEIRDLLAEAGFARSTVYWEGDDPKGGGNGVFTAADKAEHCTAWVCYVVAEK